MKNKIIGFIFATILFATIYNIKAEAKTVSEFTNVFVYWDNTYNYYRLVCTDSPVSGEYRFTYQGIDNIYLYVSNFEDYSMNNPDLYVNYLNTDVTHLDTYTAGFVCYRYLKIIKGSISGYVPNYTIEPEPEPEPPWYSEMWDTLKEELGNPAFWFGEWFINIIDSVFGDDENEPTGPPKPPLSTHVTINNPTITPAPTPIPYSTIIVPKTDPISGDTYYETNYIYNNPSGTPIVVTTPPSQPNSTGGSSNGSDYSPVGGDPYSIPQLSWLTNGVLTDDNNNTIDGIGSISDGMDSIDTIGAQYTDGMGAVQDATGTLPTSWLLLIGITAAIPLIAGIVSRFLS